MSKLFIVEQIQYDWDIYLCWEGIQCNYSVVDVVCLCGIVYIEYLLVCLGVEKLWVLLYECEFVNVLGVLIGNQVMQQVKVGLKVIYLFGWQVVVDVNLVGQMYLDQLLYLVDLVLVVVKCINNMLLCVDQLYYVEGKDDIDFLQLIVVDVEVGFGGVFNVFELMKVMIEVGVVGVYFEDQLVLVKKCGYMGGKVLVLICEVIEKFNVVCLVVDVLGVLILLVVCIDVEVVDLLISDIDGNDKLFIIGECIVEGFYKICNGLDQVISRGLVYVFYVDLVWCEIGKLDLEFVCKFVEVIYVKFFGKLLVYNCLFSFNWKKNLDDVIIVKFQCELGSYGYKFQFIILVGFYVLNYGMFNLVYGYVCCQMSVFVELQEVEFEVVECGFIVVKYQCEVGIGYFDVVIQVIQQGQFLIIVLIGLIEEEQFYGGCSECVV